MSNPLLRIWNTHATSLGEPPTNEASNTYCGYFQNCLGEEWVFVYDHEKKAGELRGGDIGWDTVVIVEDGHVDVILGKAETAWLQACWEAATFID